ncbi:PREDICTED: sorting nexin-24 [Galeopterus variegatus]|uniref:Sorting nexin-24 n=1 Tax=Galeopterus variegatus TaxID=482537 RepID=A0ABM0Q8P7_GALVR|nr:PREDICTED: sorting nexin-24 [Galeopterus variegatus]
MLHAPASRCWISCSRKVAVELDSAAKVPIKVVVFVMKPQVFKIEVLMNGRKHFVEKRYSEFHALHKKVFKIEVLMNGRKHFVEKRYSEFHALHKKLKKCIKTPEIPSKHVRNWVPKVLEQRRQGLETYLQSVILENEELPKLFLDFLNVRHLPSLPKAESCGSFDETESEESSKLSHQPVLLFLRDPYILPAASDFPNVVIEGVLHGIFYPHLQPR